MSVLLHFLQALNSCSFFRRFKSTYVWAEQKLEKGKHDAPSSTNWKSTLELVSLLVLLLIMSHAGSNLLSGPGASQEGSALIGLVSTFFNPYGGITYYSSNLYGGYPFPVCRLTLKLKYDLNEVFEAREND